jgi:polyisoprenoid-binding protein YceI
MKKSIFAFGLALALISCNTKNGADKTNSGEAGQVSQATGTEFLLVNDSTAVVNWTGSKPGKDHIGTVSVSEGRINIADNKIVSGSFTIDLNTIKDIDLPDAEWNGKLIGHLKSPDFFDVAQFPTGKFEIVSVTEKAGSDSVTISGNLTLKGITKSVSFPAEVKIGEETVSASSAPFVIDRTQWGVNYGSKSIFAELKDKFINDNIVLALNISFKKAQ